MEKTISWETLELLLDCSTTLYKYLHKALYNTEPTEDCARNVARDFCIDFLHEKGIYGVEDEDEDEADIPDDVDESNYNPYTGCDEYETDYFEEW